MNEYDRRNKDLTKKKSIGKKAVAAYIATAGTIVAVKGATATYKKLGEAVLKKIGSTTV